MQRILPVIFFLLFFAPHSRAQTAVSEDSIQATIILIGDAGQLTNGRQPVVAGAQKMVAMDKKTTVIYLGDNLYKTGLPDDMVPTYQIAKAPLDSQINIAGKSPVNVYFIPGNHDWANGGDLGYQSILRVQNYIDILGNKYVKQLPRDGCPGPVEVNVNDDVTLILLDSQWWLHENDKPGIESDCPYKTKDEVITQIDDILSRNDNKLVLFATHHPMRSYGPHGGFFTWKQHLFPFTDINPKFLFPLPVIGSAYPLTRAVFGTAQDLKHPLYQEMLNAFEGVVKGHPNVIFVSGHEHTLQMIQDSSRNYIVSGSGSKTDRVSKSRNTLYDASKNGFVTLRVSKNKTVRATFYTVAGDSVTEAFSKNILDFSKVKKLKPIGDTERIAEMVYKDSVLISASDRYKKSTAFQRFMLGQNYREEWSTPVMFPEFNINKTQGGFKIKSLGGGKQTKSLKLEDKAGKQWVLRMIDKDPEKALPENLRGTIGQALVTDMISASNPYGPLAVPDLARAEGIPTTSPKFFYVPDDPGFGYYRPLFANTVCMLEEKQPLSDETDTKSTPKMINKMLENNTHHVYQPAVLNARLLDMFIGDFDRHADQWTWGTADTGKGKLYYPVPKDRDQAYFNSDGLLVKYLSKNSMPFLQGFKDKIRNIKGLNYVARDFDRTFMNSLDRQQWKAITDTFLAHMTDTTIQKAASKYPKEIKGLDSAFTAQRLMSRRKNFEKESLQYYDFISKRVTVTGSNEREYFHLENDKGLVKLSVYSKTGESDSSTLMYRREFSRKETKELVLYGLNGDDKFEIEPDVSSRIKLRIVGGKGNDTFNIRGNMPNTIYDLSLEKNVFLNKRRTDNDMSSDPSVNDYKSGGFEYDKFVFPQINMGYNVEDKLLLGLGFSSRTYAFRKTPYSTSQKLTTLAAVNNNAFQAVYEGIFNQVVGKNDIVAHGEFKSPSLDNFFGLGNTTVYNKNLDRNYYRTRYKYISGDVLLRKRYNDIFQFSAGPAFYHYSNSFNDNKGRILAVPANIGLDSMSIYSTKQYLGVRAKLDINYINNEIFPTRGITWFTTFNSLAGMNKNSHNFIDLQSDMTIYASISDISKVSGVFRFGAGRIFSKNFEFFQAKTLGFSNYLRGYRSNRFAGRGMAYGSAEMRFRLFHSNSYVLPGDVGMLGFSDIGRVWQNGEKSAKWHSTYGGGFYFIPFNAVAVTATVGFSPEDTMFGFSIGTKFNLSF